MQVADSILCWIDPTPDLVMRENLLYLSFPPGPMVGSLSILASSLLQRPDIIAGRTPMVRVRACLQLRDLSHVLQVLADQKPLAKVEAG